MSKFYIGQTFTMNFEGEEEIVSYEVINLRMDGDRLTGIMIEVIGSNNPSYPVGTRFVIDDPEANMIGIEKN